MFAALGVVLPDVFLGAFFALVQVAICHPRVLVEIVQWLFLAALETSLG
jgi:hypothetical protein